MARIFITGSSGFIGQHLVAAVCKQGDEAVCLVRKTSPVERISDIAAELKFGDVASPEGLTEAVAGADVVVHLAGLTRALSYRELLRVNEAGVKHIAAACASQPNPPVLVVVSSLAAAGPSPFDDPRDEERPCAPVSNYGRSKLAGELVARQWAGKVPISIVRPTAVFGQWDRDCLEYFKLVAKYGFHAAPLSLRSRISLIHATDLARLLLIVADRGNRLAPSQSANDSRGIYFAADKEQPTFAEFGQLLADALDRKRIRILRIPNVCLRGVGAACEAFGRLRRRPLPMNWDKSREAVAGSWICSTARLQNELQFAPAADLPTRLGETARWYHDQGWL